MVSEAFKVELVAIDKLKAWDKNPRRHDIESLKSSIERFGFRNVVVVNRKNMTVEAGHGRIEAAKELGYQQIPVLYVEDDDMTAAAFAVADNRQNELGEWDEDALAAILKSLADAEGDWMQSVGYNDNEMRAMLRRLEPEMTTEVFVPNEESYDIFTNATIKQITLLFHSDEFDDILNSFEKVRDTEGCASNSDVVKFLFQRYEGTA